MSEAVVDVPVPETSSAAWFSTARGTWLVYTRDSWEDDWAIDPDLTWASFDQTVQPAMPQAQIRLLPEPAGFGYVRRPWDAEPEHLRPANYLGTFIKIAQVIESTAVPSDEDDETETEEMIRFVGRIEQQETTYHGQDAGGRNVGVRLPPAQGLEALLDFSIESAYVDIAGVATLVDHVPGMNRRSDRDGTLLGNRSDAKIGDSYIYSGDGDVWTHLDYIEYLIRYLNDWVFPASGITFAITGYTDGLDLQKSVSDFSRWNCRDVLNSLISRAHGHWWRCVYNEDTDEIEIRVGTTFATDLVLTPETTIVGNRNTADLSAFDDPFADDPRIIESIRAAYNYVRIVGSRVTVTGTWSYAEQSLTEGWTVAAENAYDAQVDQGLKPESPDYADVYVLHVVNPDWDGTLKNGEDVGTAHAVNVAIEPDGTIRTDLTSPLWLHEKRFMPRIPLRYGWEYLAISPVDASLQSTVPDFRPPLAIIQDTADTQLYFDATRAGGWNRRFSGAGLAPDSKDIGMRLRFQPQHVPAMDHMAAPTAQEIELDLLLNYSTLMLTATMEIDQPVQVSRRISADQVAGLDREKIIHVQDARLDILMPDTVVGIEDDGTDVLRSPDAYVELRNDIPQLQAVAALAERWYGTVAEKIVFRYRRLIRIAEPGEIVTQFMEAHHLQDVNALVSRVVWDFGSEKDGGSVTVETGYVELDPVGFALKVWDRMGIHSGENLAEQINTMRADVLGLL